MTSDIPLAQRYERAVRSTAPKLATDLAGRVTGGYWLEDEFFYVADAYAEPLGRSLPLPWIASPERASTQLVISPENLPALLFELGQAGPESILTAQFDMLDRNTVAMAVDDLQIVVDRRTGRLTSKVSAAAPGGRALYSPDGRYASFIKGHDLWLQERQTGEEYPITTDGAPHYCYGQQSQTSLTAISQRGSAGPVGLWSPDSQWFLTHRIDERSVPEMTLVQHAPPGRAFSVSHTLKVALPGEPLPKGTYLAVHAASRRKVLFEEASFPLANSSPFFSRLAWFDGPERAWCIRRDRYCRVLELIELDLTRGTSRVALREETGHGYLDVNPLVTASPNVRSLSGSGEIIWFSERDGYGHLYLYDAHTGTLKNRITEGKWLVRNVLHVDVARRKILLLAGGINPEADPAHRSLCSVSFDGGDWRVLLSHAGDIFVPPTEPCGLEQDRALRPDSARRTPGVSPDGRFAVIRYTNAAQGNWTELVELQTGSVCPLVSARPADGEVFAREFVASAADGATRLHGMMFLPPGFEESGHYPLVVYVYPGPQVAHKPQAYQSINAAPAASLAELGFVTVMLDTRGMPIGSRSFHQMGYPALQEPQLADHAEVVRTLCLRHSFLDADRVGIVGHSAGGAAAMRALFDYGDVFKVGVAVCGYNDSAYCPAAWADKYRGPDGGRSEAEKPNSMAAHKLRGRLLLISGDLDENVHVSHTLAVASALVQANRDFDLLIVPNETHLLLMTSGYVQRRVWDYFVRHLLQQEPPHGFELKFEPRELACFAARYGQEFRE